MTGLINRCSEHSSIAGSRRCDGVSPPTMAREKRLGVRLQLILIHTEGQRTYDDVSSFFADFALT